MKLASLTAYVNRRLLVMAGKYVAVAIACVSLSCLTLSQCDVNLRDIVMKGIQKIGSAQGAKLDRSVFSDGLCFTAQEGLPGFGNCFFHKPGKHDIRAWSGNGSSMAFQQSDLQLRGLWVSSLTKPSQAKGLRRRKDKCPL